MHLDRADTLAPRLQPHTSQVEQHILRTMHHLHSIVKETSTHRALIQALRHNSQLMVLLRRDNRVTVRILRMVAPQATIAIQAMDPPLVNTTRPVVPHSMVDIKVDMTPTTINSNILLHRAINTHLHQIINILLQISMVEHHNTHRIRASSTRLRHKEVRIHHLVLQHTLETSSLIMASTILSTLVGYMEMHLHRVKGRVNIPHNPTMVEILVIDRKHILMIGI